MPTVSLSSPSILQFLNNSGQPNAGGTLLTQVGGVNAATYQDAAGTISLPNPIPLNARGEVSNAAGVSCQLFLAAGSAYTFTLLDPVGNQINQASNVIGVNNLGASLLASSGSSLVGYSQGSTGAIASTVQTKLRETASVRDFGAVGDGVANDKAPISLADSQGSIIFSSGTYRISSNITIANISTFFPGASLSIDAGVVVTFSSAVYGPLTTIFTGFGTVVLTKVFPYAIPEWWGASPAVNSGAAINKMIAACTANFLPIAFSQTYPIETLITIPSLMSVFCVGNPTFNAAGGAVNGVRILNGNGTKMQIPYLAGFTGYGLKLSGTNISQIDCIGIANCGDGFVQETINTSYSYSLDNKISIFSLTNCINGIRIIADNNACVMQGNEIYVNFANNCTNACKFDGVGLSPSWDGYKIVFQAIDPQVAIVNARGLLSNAVAVPRLTFRVESWIGAFASTAKYIEGNFNLLSVYLKLAESPANYAMFNISGTGNYIDTVTKSGAGTTPVAAMNAAALRATFNGGLPLWGNKEFIRWTVTVGGIAANAITDIYIYHIKTDGFSEQFRIIPRSMQGMTVTSIIDQSSTNANEIRIRLLNSSGALIAAGQTIDFYFEIGV